MDAPQSVSNISREKNSKSIDEDASVLIPVNSALSFEPEETKCSWSFCWAEFI